MIKIKNRLKENNTLGEKYHLEGKERTPAPDKAEVKRILNKIFGLKVNNKLATNVS